MIVRNEDLQAARVAMRSLEDRFNYAKGYPWILLNPQSYTSDFKRYARKVTQAKVYFGRIDLDAWVPPYWIDMERAEKLMMGLYKRKVPNAMSMSFHQEVRYQTGLFYYHSLFDHVDYVWRVEPGSSYSCDMIDDDPFVAMKTLNKTLGFVLTGSQDGNSTINLWKASTHFIEENRELVLSRNDTIMPWIVDESDEAITSRCRIWSNFELVDMSFFRTESYRRFFHFLDLVGGFFYERWTDGDVRTLAAAMFLKKEQLHFFNNIGYSQGSFNRCPLNAKLLEKCSCDYKNSDDFKSKGCTLDLLEKIDSTVVDDMIDFATSVKLKRKNQK
ncbi:glycosyltransferase family 15 protein [Backusella circina FSU 941]|nr:glycosyltransferase family 15 protein [Backusella circina FSU 941]